MKGIFINCLLLIIIGMTNGNGKLCNDAFNPCECYDLPKENAIALFCRYNITDKNLDKIHDYLSHNGNNLKLDTVMFENTQMTNIRKDYFADASVSELIIEHNENLEKIDTDAFKSISKTLRWLQIGHNKKLLTDSVFEIARNSPNLTYFQVASNISKIPPRTFESKFTTESKLTDIVLDSNGIKSIGSYAFTKLPHLTDLHLSNNGIMNIDDNALTLSAIKTNLSVVINLRYNGLTSEKFSSKSLDNPEKVAISLDLSNNNFTNFKDDVFKAFVKSNKANHIELRDNPIDCDCSMKWVFDLPRDEQNKFSNVICVKQKKSIFQLTSKDFINCH